jgi:hypothetical protein
LSPGGSRKSEVNGAAGSGTPLLCLTHMLALPHHRRATQVGTGKNGHVIQEDVSCCLNIMFYCYNNSLIKKMTG